MKTSSIPSLFQAKTRRIALALLSAGGISLLTCFLAAEESEAKKPASPSGRQSVTSTENKRPIRSLEESGEKGLEYLLKQQHQDGGWGQGGGWRQNGKQSGARVEAANVEDPSDLGNTSISLMTLLRAGHHPAGGEHREAAVKAFDYVCKQVEQADVDSLFVTSVRDTQLQVKIGPFVDTFLAGWVLSELNNHVADSDEKRRAAALDKIVKKIEKNQKSDGSFAGNHGWAAVLSQGLCSKALNRASQNGANVAANVLAQDQIQNTAGLDVTTGRFSAGASTVGSSAISLPAGPVATATPSDAGISIYRESSKLGGLWERSKTNAIQKPKSEAVLADANANDEMKDKARGELKQIETDEQAKAVAVRGVAEKLGDASYTAGFGNNGGEEFLSYMNLSEIMHEKGGKDWEDWKLKMIKTLCGAQNEDGSWSGHHCITGHTFCTATALLTLMVERMPVAKPAAAVKDSETKPAVEAVPVKVPAEK